MNVQRKQRNDNPFTEHDEDTQKKHDAEPDGVDVARSKPDEDRVEDKVVAVEPADKDDDDGGPTPRQQRKRERYDEMQRERDDAHRRAAEAEARAAAIQVQAQMRPQEKPKDPFEEEEKQIESDWQKHLAYADAMKQATPEDVTKWRSEYRAILNRQQVLAAKRVQRESGQGQPVNMAEEMVKAHIRANHGDIIAGALPDRPTRAMVMADGIMMTRLAREGRSHLTQKDYDEAFAETRRILRMPGAQAPAPSEETRRKFSGHGLNGASNGSTRSEGRGEIRMSAEMQEMAESQYKWGIDKNGKKYRLKPEEAHAKWAQNAGKKVLAKHG